MVRKISSLLLEKEYMEFQGFSEFVKVEIIIGLQVLTGTMNPRHKIPTIGH